MTEALHQTSIHAELRQLIRRPAPRQLSPFLRKHVSRGSGHRFMMLFGFVFAAFGSVFCVIFLPWKLLDEFTLDKAPPLFVDGRVTHAEKSNMSINEVPVWKYKAKFTDGSHEMTSVGYTTGRSFAEGDEVSVRVHPQKPDLHCPEGMRMSKGSPGSSFVLLFPLLGFSVMVAPWFTGRQRLRLYENGSVADVQVLSVRETKMFVNDRRVVQFTVKFPHLPETMKVNKSNYEEVHALRNSYETQKPLHVLYDPKKPKRFVIVEVE